MKKIIIYGLGKHFNSAFHKLQTADKLHEFLKNVVVFSDIDESMHGKKIHGR